MGQSTEMRPVIIIKGYKHFNKEINDASTLVVDESDDLYR
jgi:F420-0:gamma-glutamyl ligase